MNAIVPIRKDFALLRPYLIGSPKQFLIAQGSAHCVRAHPDDLEGKDKNLDPCQGCPHLGNGCKVDAVVPIEAAKKSDGGVVSGMEPHVRRGIGMEERAFLVLQFKPGCSHATMPKELWDNPYADKAMDERNLHFLLTNLKRTKFLTLKGQLRYYGTVAEFETSAYAEFLTVFDEYDPKSHHLISMDKSAIEPRVCTIVTDEPEWRKVFEGKPKIISREIELAAEPEKDPDYLYRARDKIYCYLEGELDKATYDSQCKKCPLANMCEVKVDHLKMVAGDWHAINAEGFFGAAFSETSDPYVRKEFRNKSKIGGLASIYGGSKFTLSRSLNMTEEEAESALIAFFSKLGVARKYMEGIKNALRTHGKVTTRFGRRRDMRRWSHSEAMMPSVRKRRVTGEDGRVTEIEEPILQLVTQADGTVVEQPVMVPDRRKRFKDFGYAERTGLNYPIQGTAAELMKMAMIQVDQMIQRNGWNPLAGLTLPQQMQVGNRAYERINFALLSTVHDELLYMIRAGAIDTVIPQAYTAMQLGEVMKALDAGFALELDVEYDAFGAWTAGTSVPTAKIYLLNRIASSTGASPNVFVVPIADTDDAFFAALASDAGSTTETDQFHLAVEQSGRYLYYPNGKRFGRSFLETVAAASGIHGSWVSVADPG